jgi:hypothetical protein
MPLQISTGGNSKPFIRFLPSLNAWQLSTEAGKDEFAFDKPAVFDIQFVQLGWMHIDEGVYDWQPWPNNRPTAKPAEEGYKAGFMMNVYSTTMFGDEPVREFASNGTGSVMFVQELFNACEQAPEFAQGKSPVIQITGSKAIKVGKKGGATRIPQFTIVKWIDRPQALGGGAPAPAAAAPAPAPAAKPAPAVAETSEF